MQVIGLSILYGSQTSWLRASGILETVPAIKLLVLIWVVEEIATETSLLLRIAREEAIMKSHFGDEWERWANVVRYRLIPGIY